MKPLSKKSSHIRVLKENVSHCEEQFEAVDLSVNLSSSTENETPIKKKTVAYQSDNWKVLNLKRESGSLEERSVFSDLTNNSGIPKKKPKVVSNERVEM